MDTNTQTQELEQQMAEGTPKFVEAALTKRLKEIFPQITDEQLPGIVTIIHDDMRSAEDSGMLQKLAEFELGVEETVKREVFDIQWAIEGAIMGMGIDILDTDAVDRIIWSRQI